MDNSNKRVNVRFYHFFLFALFLLFFISMFLLNKNGSNEWQDSEIEGIIVEVSVNKNDKYTCFMLDSVWYRFGTRNPDFENICYIDFYLKKSKGESCFWIVDKSSKDSISYSVHSGSVVDKESDIYWIEKTKIVWDR